MTEDNTEKDNRKNKGGQPYVLYLATSDNC